MEALDILINKAEIERLDKLVSLGEPYELFRILSMEGHGYTPIPCNYETAGYAFPLKETKDACVFFEDIDERLVGTTYAEIEFYPRRKKPDLYRLEAGILFQVRSDKNPVFVSREFAETKLIYEFHEANWRKEVRSPSLGNLLDAIVILKAKMQRFIYNGHYISQQPDYLHLISVNRADVDAFWSGPDKLWNNGWVFVITDQRNRHDERVRRARFPETL